MHMYMLLCRRVSGLLSPPRPNDMPRPSRAGPTLLSVQNVTGMVLVCIILFVAVDIV